jgi:hypothetical protein
MIIVDVFEDETVWYWQAEQVKLRRGPFADREQAEQDADDLVQELIAIVTGREGQ